MKSSNLLFITSWVLLLILAGVITLLSLQSLRVAYFSRSDGLTSEFGLSQIQEQGGEEAAKAFRGRRVTAATWALGCGLLAIAVIWIPYRRGEPWAWWSLLVGFGVSQLLSIARALALATTAGISAPATILALALMGLLAGVPRMFTNRD